MKIDQIWMIVLAWFALSIIFFCIIGDWSLVIYSIGFGVIYGGIAYRYRRSVRPVIKNIRLDNYAGFLLLAIIVTVFEETFCYITGNHIAYPVLWIDLMMISILWTVWFGTWYFYISRKYAFSEKEALMVAALTGILYEGSGNISLYTNPIGIILVVPLAIIIYGAIFLLPMQLIDFTGKNTSRWKYPVSVLLPFALTIPVVILLFATLSLLHVLS